MERIKCNKKIILDIKKSFQNSKLNSRIICLIIHGSSLFYPLNNNHLNSDIDLELILEKPEPEDYQIIKNIINKSKIKIECQLRYLEEIENQKSLIFLSHYKIFMYFAYANGICLIGKNIYRNLVKDISYKTIEESLLISAQIYFKDIRKSLFKGDIPYWVNKNIGYALLDICLIEGFLDYRRLGEKVILKEEKWAFIRPIIKNYSLFLNKIDKKILKEFAKKYHKKKIFEQIFPVINKIFKIFEKRYLKNE